MHELFGCTLSAGTLANLVTACAEGLVETELKIKRRLRRSAVIHADETGMRVGKRLRYVHVASTAHLTHKAWAEPLKELLLEMKVEVEREREGGAAGLAQLVPVGRHGQPHCPQLRDELTLHA